MDRLNDLLTTAAPLLHRVDDVLSAAGAPPEHRVWAEMRRVRLLPGDAARAIAALRPDELREVAPELRADARAYAVLATSLPAPGEWTGQAADTYDAARRRAADRLSGSPDSLDERLQAAADLADALVTWMRSAREALAGVLAEVLLSAEAVTLTESAVDVPVQDAAAEVAARVLEVVAESLTDGTDLLHRSAELSGAALG